MATELKETEYTKKVRHLNDTHRKLIPISRTVLTRGVAALEPFKVACLLDAIRNFDEFVEDNDPYGEHDFGRLSGDDVLYYWKIDYYAKDDFMYGSDDPSDANKTSRVLTLMRADEY